jgi:hypothetical protein
MAKYPDELTKLVGLSRASKDQLLVVVGRL